MTKFLLLLASFFITVSGLSQAQIDQQPLHESKPEKRVRMYYERRAFPYDTIPEGANIRAYQEQQRYYTTKRNGAQILAEQPLWRQAGPVVVGGRTRSIVHHPTNESILYVGAANGGVWKTSNAGALWTPVMDFAPSISMGALAIDKQNPDVLYAATGEFASGHYGYAGAGVFKTTNAGVSWQSVGLSNVGGFSKIYVHPLNSNLIYAAAVYSNAGFYKSTDGGASWRKTLSNGNVSDISINPNDPNDLIIGVSGVGIFRSTDGGETWGTKLKLPFTSHGRVSVQMAPSEPNTVYALLDRYSSNGVVIRTKDKGLTWETLLNDPNIFSTNNQGGYDNFIEVHPTNPAIVLVGGVNLFRTGDDGANWTQVGGYGQIVHPDMHCCAFSPIDPSVVYVGCDGGMNRSDDAGETWAVINNELATTQFHGNFAMDQTKQKVMYGGTQDNGTLSNTSTQWGDLLGGDGGFVALDSRNSSIIYAETQQGQNITRVDRKNGTSTKISDGIPANDKGAWAAPLVIDQETNTLFSGRRALYATTNQGQTWERVSPSQSAVMSAIAVSLVNPEIIFIGYENGRLMVTTTAGGTSSSSWTTINTNGLPTRAITDIELSQNDENIAFVTLSGYNTDHVYKTTDLGKTWKNIGKSLPNTPTNCITIHPDDEKILFVGTDVGVFCTYNGGDSWIPLGTGFPTTSIMDMQFYTGSPVVPNTIILRVSTHGRSMWEVDVPNDVITPISVDEQPMQEKSNSLTVSAYPNPASGTVYISYTLAQPNQHLKIEVTNLLGATVQTLFDAVIPTGGDIHGILPLETHALTSGIYTVIATLGNGERVAHRIIISH